MKQKENILEELWEIQSELEHKPQSYGYQVPSGYFDGLAERILLRVKGEDIAGLKADFSFGDVFNEATAETSSTTDELAILSPFLNSISRVSPFTVPSGYFEELSELVPFFAEDSDVKDSQPSELLASISKENPYTVPAGYFKDVLIPESVVIPGVSLAIDGVGDKLIEETSPITQKVPGKVISMNKSRTFLRYAAAAAVIACVAVSSLLYFNREEQAESIANSFAWVEKNLKKVSTEDINKFVEATADNNISRSDKPEEIRNLLQDVSDKEIQQFLNDTPLDESDLDDVLLN